MVALSPDVSLWGVEGLVGGWLAGGVLRIMRDYHVLTLHPFSCLSFLLYASPLVHGFPSGGGGRGFLPFAMSPKPHCAAFPLSGAPHSLTPALDGVLSQFQDQEFGGRGAL